jgi:hypothetical protein
MSFIEVHNNVGKHYTINVDRILTVSPHLNDPAYTGVKTEITLAGGSVHAPSRALVRESYSEVRRLMGLGVEE